MRNILVLILLLFTIGCSEENDFKEPLTFDHFLNYLQADMSYTSIVDVFGEPKKDVGSGIHIYVYELTDSTEIWIAYVDSILYVRHFDENHQLLHTVF